VIAGEDLEVMSVVKSLWAMVQGDPVFMRRINGWLAIFWVAMIPISLVMHWVSSVIYVSALSLWALVSGHWSAWQAARVEVNQELEARKRDKEDVATDVVAKIVRRDRPQACYLGLDGVISFPCSLTHA
jgi:cobalamin biosynthesis protein CobD/CbiB